MAETQSLLDGLDADLFAELNSVVRSNQLSCLPFAKSGQAEEALHRRHPSLAGEIEEERRVRIREMTYRSIQHEPDGKSPSSYRQRYGSLEDTMQSSPALDKARRGSRTNMNVPFSPSLRPVSSRPDLMFDMEEDEPVDLSLVTQRLGSLAPLSLAKDVKRRESVDGLQEHVTERSRQHSTSPRTWSSPTPTATKIAMREILAQTSVEQSLPTRQRSEDAKDASSSTKPVKLSQRERKKQQQVQTLDSSSIPPPTLNIDRVSPWQLASPGPKVAVKDILENVSPAIESPTSSKPPTHHRTCSPDTRFSGQRRPSNHAHLSPPASSLNIPKSAQSSSPLVPHSRRYVSPVAEPSLQLSMKDIIGQQERELEIRKEAVAKRSLMEIQEEQAFQEWWDEESKKVKEAANLALEQRQKSSELAEAVKSTSRRGRGRGRGGSGSSSGAAGDRGRGKGRPRAKEEAVRSQKDGGQESSSLRNKVAGNSTK